MFTFRGLLNRYPKLETLLVYIEKRTTRTDYIFRLVLEDIAGFSVQFTSDPTQFMAFDGAKFSYGSVSFGRELHVQASGLLEEKGLKIQSIKSVEYQDVKCPFAVDQVSLFPFDPFSAAFYLVTRYEEYGTPLLDLHGRFDARNSLAYRQGFLEKPVVNTWALELRKKILERFPKLSYKPGAFRFIATIDVDQAYAYRGKNAKRIVGRFFKNIIEFKVGNIIDMLLVLVFNKKDPYDTFDYLIAVKQKRDLELIYFLHLGDYGPYDKSLRWDHPLMKKLIQKISASGLIGIHPSYRSNERIEILWEECERYKQLLNQSPRRSRQHYLKLSFPETYTRLIVQGITEDYTMGYAKHTGFRASICTPFKFYDLSTESCTNLSVYPFVVMDGTLKDVIQLPPVMARKKNKELLATVKDVDGLFIMIWHNHSLSDRAEWKGWKDVFKKIIKHNA